MKPLIDLINEAYAGVKGDLPYASVESFITNDNKSAEFIRSILHDNEFEKKKKNSNLYALAKTRARHSAITFLIGLIFFKYLDFEEMILNSSYVQKYSGHSAAIRLWMITALYHDCGYFLEDIGNPEINYKSKVKYYLLDDSYMRDELKILEQFSIYYRDVLAYTYDEIENYDTCSRQWRKDLAERVDHGILGGIHTFDQLIKRALKNEMPINRNELLAIKACCLTIAQHNIFKSESKERDAEYGSSLKKLHSTSEFVINSSTPLLLMLSLVDTFECVKKLSKSENMAHSLETLTVLSNISLFVSDEELIIDFSKLDQRVNGKDDVQLKTTYSKYKENLLKLKNWTSFIVNYSDNEAIKIKVDSSKVLNNCNVRVVSETQ